MTGGRETASLLNGDNGILDGYRRDHDYFDDENDGTDLAQVRQASDRASQQFAANPEGSNRNSDHEECKY